MAMLRDTVARTVIDPTPEDIAAIRRQAVDSLISMGAAPDSIEVQMEIDQQKNIVQATATGSLQMEQQDLGMAEPARRNYPRSPQTLCGSSLGRRRWPGRQRGYLSFPLYAGSAGYSVCSTGMSKISGCWTDVGWSNCRSTTGSFCAQAGGGSLPTLTPFCRRYPAITMPGRFYLRCLSFTGSRIVDLSSVLVHDQVMQLAALELEGAAPDTPICVLTHPRK